MNIEGWKLVPVEPTQEMEDAFESVEWHRARFYRASYQAMLAAAPTKHLTVTTNEAGEAVAVTWQDDEHRILEVVWEKAAPTPPAHEDEPVAYQAWHPNFPTWVSCSKSVAEQFLERNEGHTIRPLYTRPDNLRKAAQCVMLEWDKNRDIYAAIQILRAALEGK